MDQIIFSRNLKAQEIWNWCWIGTWPNQRIWPGGLDIAASGTRKERETNAERAGIESLLIFGILRRLLTTMAPARQSIKTLLDVMGKQKTNAALLAAAAPKV